MPVNGPSLGFLSNDLFIRPKRMIVHGNGNWNPEFFFVKVAKRSAKTITRHYFFEIVSEIIPDSDFHSYDQVSFFSGPRVTLSGVLSKELQYLDN